MLDDQVLANTQPTCNVPLAAVRIPDFVAWLSAEDPADGLTEVAEAYEPSPTPRLLSKADEVSAEEHDSKLKTSRLKNACFHTRCSRVSRAIVA